MKIENTQTIDPADIAAIETSFSCKLTPEIQDFLKQYNGQIVDPEDGVLVNSVTHTGRGIKDWLTVIYDPKAIIERLPYAPNIQHVLDQRQWDKDVFQMDNLMPIMSTMGGSINLHIAVRGEHAGKLFIIDNGDNGLSKVSLTLAELGTLIES